MQSVANCRTFKTVSCIASPLSVHRSLKSNACGSDSASGKNQNERPAFDRDQEREKCFVTVVFVENLGATMVSVNYVICATGLLITRNFRHSAASITMLLCRSTKNRRHAAANGAADGGALRGLRPLDAVHGLVIALARGRPERSDSRDDYFLCPAQKLRQIPESRCDPISCGRFVRRPSGDYRQTIWRLLAYSPRNPLGSKSSRHPHGLNFGSGNHVSFHLVPTRRILWGHRSSDRQ